MLFAGLLAARKQVPTWRLGSAQFWLRGHIWLGALSVPLILFHCGFGWGGLLENLLCITFAVVIASGFFGLAVQQILPRFWTTRIPFETFNAQVPFLCQSMQFLSDKFVAEKCGKLDVAFEPLKPVAQAVARQKKWLKRESDFENLLFNIYSTAPTPAKKERPTAKKNAVTPKPKSAEPKSDMSPLKQMRAQEAQATKDSDGSGKPTQPKSPLQLARTQAANAEQLNKPKSPLELTHAQGAKARKTMPTVAQAKEKTKKNSLQQPVLRTAELKEFYVNAVRPYLDAHGNPPQLGGKSDAKRVFAQMRANLPVELHDALMRLEANCEERRQFAIQQRIHRWMHYWLFVHIPISIVLLVLLAAHAIVSLRVVPF